MQPRPRLRDERLEATFERDGYFVVDQLLEPGEIEHLLEVFRSNDTAVHHTAYGASILSDDLEYRSTIDREIKAIVRSKAEALFNGYRMCFSNFLVKPPSRAQTLPESGEVQLHQDISLVDERHYQTISLWCPLVDVDAGNGCLFVVPGSNRFNSGPRGPATVHPYRDLDPLLVPLSRAVPLKAGSAMFFCQKLFHSSPPNRSAAPRIAIAALFAPHDAELRCYFQIAGTRRMEVFAVDDDFYTRYKYRSRPEGVPRLGEVDYWYEPIDRKKIEGLVAG